MTAPIHKRNSTTGLPICCPVPPMPPLTGPADELAGLSSRTLAGLVDTGTATSDYWGNVTCPDCLARKPDDAGGRMSVKRSHRAEGISFVD